MSEKRILPVIHHLDYETTYTQGVLAIKAGADGVFLISHQGENSDLYAPAQDLKTQFPGALIGLNLLGEPPVLAFHQVLAAHLDMVWADTCGVSSRGVTETAEEISHLLSSMAAPPRFFGSVAFKYQPDEPNPSLAARLALGQGMIPTTSGSGTGHAPSVEKIASMREGIGAEAPLAVASGMTAENVAQFLPYLTHFLVSTGITKDFYHLDPSRLDAFIRMVRG